MHEYKVTKDLLDIVLKQAEEAGAGTVNRVNVVIGEICGYPEDGVRFYFEQLAKGTDTHKLIISIYDIYVEHHLR